MMTVDEKFDIATAQLIDAVSNLYDQFGSKIVMAALGSMVSTFLIEQVDQGLRTYAVAWLDLLNRQMSEYLNGGGDNDDGDVDKAVVVMPMPSVIQ